MASNPKTENMDAVLAAYRKSIDNIDAALIHMLAERFRITQAVGEYKAEAGLPASDPAREARQIERLRALAVDADLDPEFSEKFIRFVIDEVKSRVAIWKHERYADGDVQWLHPDTTVAGESNGREEDR